VSSRAPFPQLRLREPESRLLDLPWELPLEDWSADAVTFRDLPIGPSRHLVRFVVADEVTYALKELPIGPASREFSVLRHLRELRLPAVRPVGIAESPERDAAVLVTAYLAHSLQYRRLLMRFPIGPGPYRDRLLDAMASLLVDLHRAGVFWGDCSLGAAIETYLAAGASAPETGAGPSGSIDPEIDWAAGLDVRGSDGDQDDLDPVDNPTSAARQRRVVPLDDERPAAICLRWPVRRTGGTARPARAPRRPAAPGARPPPDRPARQATGTRLARPRPR